MFGIARAVAVALVIGSSTATAQDHKKYSPDNPFAKTLEERIEEEVQLRARSRARSRAIGLSRSITCGKKIVTIPLIAEGEHIASITIWKSSISGITYPNPTTLQSNSPGAKAIADTIQIGLKERPGDDLGLVTTKRNYAPLLECLDRD